MTPAESAAAGRPTQTSPEAWVQAALDELEQSGVRGLAVEAVARRLGVSKGGFYHHFSDRRELLSGAIDLWQQRFVVELTATLDAIEDPTERLHATLTRALVDLEPTVIVRLMDALDEPLAATALAYATRMRLALLTRTFIALGFDLAEAEHRALTTYGLYLGIAQLRRQDPTLPATPGYLADLEAMLLAGPARSAEADQRDLGVGRVAGLAQAQVDAEHPAGRRGE